MYIDSHVHLSHRLFNGTVPWIGLTDGDAGFAGEGTREELISALKTSGMMCCIEPGIEAASNDAVKALSQKYPRFLYRAVGVHPTRTPGTPWKAWKQIQALASEPGVVAVGETGLDYHYPREKQHRLRQMVWFGRQIMLAHRLRLPLILHIREANQEAIRLLRLFRRWLHGGVCHCFSGDLRTARIFTGELGLCLGIGGAILSDRESLCEVVREIPLEYLLLETDSPYVKPPRPEGISNKAWQKARNTSLILPAVARRIAELKGISSEMVEQATAENARRVFRLPEDNG